MTKQLLKLYIILRWSINRKLLKKKEIQKIQITIFLANKYLILFLSFVLPSKI